jgi:hypothetical protein
MDMTIEEYKKKIDAEFHFSESYCDDNQLNIYFNPGTILLTPMTSHNHRRWISKAFFEWERGGRTIVVITQFKTGCKYFKNLVTAVAEVRLINECLIYDNKKFPNKQMIMAIYKAKPLKELNHLVTFN